MLEKKAMAKTGKPQLATRKRNPSPPHRRPWSRISYEEDQLLRQTIATIADARIFSVRHPCKELDVMPGDVLILDSSEPPKIGQWYVETYFHYLQLCGDDSDLSILNAEILSDGESDGVQEILSDSLGTVVFVIRNIREEIDGRLDSDAYLH